MQIATEHNGHKIIYSENKDVWRCMDMDAEAKTLSALRVKLNKLDADARRVENVPVIKIRSYGGTEMTGEATLLEGNNVWVVSGKDKTTRGKEPLDSLVLDTPDMRRDIIAARALQEAAEKAQTAARHAWQNLKRVTADELKAVAKKVEGEKE